MGEPATCQVCPPTGTSRVTPPAASTSAWPGYQSQGWQSAWYHTPTRLSEVQARSTDAEPSMRTVAHSRVASAHGAIISGRPNLVGCR